MLSGMSEANDEMKVFWWPYCLSHQHLGLYKCTCTVYTVQSCDRVDDIFSSHQFPKFRAHDSQSARVPRTVYRFHRDKSWRCPPPALILNLHTVNLSEAERTWYYDTVPKDEKDIAYTPYLFQNTLITLRQAINIIWFANYSDNGDIFQSDIVVETSQLSSVILSARGVFHSDDLSSLSASHAV